MKMIAITAHAGFFCYLRLTRACFHIYFLTVFILCISFTCHAQTSNSVINIPDATTVFADSSVKLFISSINVTGNKKTKKYIIEREMQLKEGDSVPATAIYEKLLRSKDLVYNTALFTEVNIEPFFLSATNVSIQVTVKEKWYIYPSPQFQLVDRSFNEWVKTYNADLERVVYGVKFAHYNLSGRRDQLRIYLLNGYARNFSFNYTAPYSNRVLTEGFSLSAGYTQNRDVIYKTSSDNRPLRYSNEGFVRKSFTVAAGYIKRRGFYRKHVFSISYTNLNVDDSITSTYNTAYFNKTGNSAGFPDLSYTFQYINTNNINYPLTGKIYSFSLLKRGAGFNGGINLLSIDAGYNRFVGHGKNWYSILHGQVKIKMPAGQAYINQRALGYGDFYLRGLENYVIDGLHAFTASYTLKKKIVSFKIPVPFKNKVIPFVPFTIFAKTYTDAGYAYSKMVNDTRLGNRLLYTGGFGIDILSLYDINLKVEYSFNQLGQKGLFLHAKGGF